MSKMMDEKINSIIPKLIEKITKAVQLRMQLEGCCHCSKKESFSKLSNIGSKSLLKKMNFQCNEC
jgi:hypothetical protein